MQPPLGPKLGEVLANRPRAAPAPVQSVIERRVVTGLGRAIDLYA